MAEKFSTFRQFGGRFLKVTKLMQSCCLSICLPVTLLLVDFEPIGQPARSGKEKCLQENKYFFDIGIVGN